MSVETKIFQIIIRVFFYLIFPFDVSPKEFHYFFGFILYITLLSFRKQYFQLSKTSKNQALTRQWLSVVPCLPRNCQILLDQNHAFNPVSEMTISVFSSSNWFLASLRLNGNFCSYMNNQETIKTFSWIDTEIRQKLNSFEVPVISHSKKC